MYNFHSSGWPGPITWPLGEADRCCCPVCLGKSKPVSTEHACSPLGQHPVLNPHPTSILVTKASLTKDYRLGGLKHEFVFQIWKLEVEDQDTGRVGL
jgi:hypothetical protein